jgi:heme exporter protein D
MEWSMSPPGKSRSWVWLHWAIALAPFAAVIGLSVWGYGRYVWLPFVAGILCPVGAALVGLQVKRDRDRMRSR